MENRIHLNVFDFDETLFRVPGYTCKEARGKTPYEWFDSPESLSQEFNIRPIINTCEQTQDQLFVRSALVTHRVEECKYAVESLLNRYSVQFDHKFFLGRESAKADTVLNLIDECAAASVTIYEDSLFEIIKYVEAFDKAEIQTDVSVEFVFVDKSRVINLSWEAACLIEQTCAIEKLRIG